MEVSNCALPGSVLTLGRGRSWGIMGVDYIEDGFGFDSVFVINLVIYSCFTVSIWNLSTVSIKLPFSVMQIISTISLMGPMEWLLSSRWVAKLKIMEIFITSFME